MMYNHIGSSVTHMISVAGLMLQLNKVNRTVKHKDNNFLVEVEVTSKKQKQENNSKPWNKLLR